LKGTKIVSVGAVNEVCAAGAKLLTACSTLLLLPRWPLLLDALPLLLPKAHAL
jgi:hypothetical protein